MTRLLEMARRLSRIGAWGGGLLVLAAAVLTVVEIMARKVFDVSLGGASTLAGYMFACGTAWAMALTLIDRAHVRVDIAYFHVPQRVRGLLNLLALLALAVFVSFLVQQSWSVFYDSYRFGARDLTPMRIHLVYPQFVWFLGMLLFFMVSVLLFVASLRAFLTGDEVTLNAIAAPTSADDEISSVQTATAAGEK